MLEGASAVAEAGSLFRLDGKSALIVGGYGGIGQTTSQLFAQAGATLVIAGRSLERASALATELAEVGHRAFGAQVDVSDGRSVQNLIAVALDRLEGLDIVVNLASIEIHGKAEEFDGADWQRVLDVNLTGAFYLSQMAGRTMIANGTRGRIVHFSSTRSVAGARLGLAAYGASKAGLNLLIKQLATEWAPHGITVNGVGPGFVPTPMVEETAANPRFSAMMLNRIPMGRFGRPLEMASAALFFASPAASFITGQILFVDGGVTASS